MVHRYIPHLLLTARQHHRGHAPSPALILPQTPPSQDPPAMGIVTRSPEKPLYLHDLLTVNALGFLSENVKGMA